MSLNFSNCTVLMNNSVMDSGRFSKSPMSLTIVANERAEFHCQHTTADRILWNINGSSPREFPESAVIESSDVVFSPF